MDFKLYNADCFDILPSIPDESIDLILCDMPYGTTKNKWDTVLDLNKMWIECERIIKRGGDCSLLSATFYIKAGHVQS